jgi:hypothetical protein
MTRHLAAVAVVVGILAASADVSAKEISKVSVCGMAGQCKTYDKADFKSLMFLAEDAGPTDPPAAAGPWYRVRFTVDEREHGGGYARWTVAYVPSVDKLRVRDEGGDFAWVALNPRSAAVFKRAVRTLPAFPKARLRGLHVRAPQAQVDEVFMPDASSTATRDGTDAATTPWGWITAGASMAALVLFAVARVLRRRRQIKTAPI